MISYPVRISEEGMKFLKNFQTNRIRIGTDEISISYINAINLIVKFFKDNNDQYIKLAKMEYKKDGH